jgi:RES domain-containing protein
MAAPTPTAAATRWRLCVPDEGDPYYFNLDSQEAAWTLPPDLVGVLVPPFTVEDEAAVAVLQDEPNDAPANPAATATTAGPGLGDPGSGPGPGACALWCV